ncbi:uncharacterized protein LOC135213175 [Macrobrachium nipponense]|uniref:uncharacterized protein LOC135213175 n=1 Tax=Macrobrachium nipponense TaxID=159736 RepID=UPI0030C8263D
MGKKDDVIFVGDHHYSSKDPSWYYMSRRVAWMRDKEKALLVLVVFFIALIAFMFVCPETILNLQSSLGNSERDPPDYLKAKIDIVPPSKVETDNELANYDSIEEAIPVSVSTPSEVEDFLDYADEVEGLRSHVGDKVPHPDSVAFILPLRDHVGNLGVRFGKQLKNILESSRPATEDGTPGSELMGRSSEQRNFSTILGKNSTLQPSHVLLRDSKGDFEVARQLTQHFYEDHGTTRFFGLLTDEEAMAAAIWARVRAPGARFVTPTAISTYLDNAPNVLRVQPSAKVLATAVADLMFTLNAARPLMVVRASLHTDAFVALLRSLGIKPSQVIHYYETTKFEDLAEKIRLKVTETLQPVLLLGDSESWEIIHIADTYYSCLWICPFPTQLHDHIQTSRSELIYFMYRAYDDKPEHTMKENPLLDPNESLVKASLSLLNGKRRSWRGSYVVVASVSPESVNPHMKVLGGTDLIPVMQYDVNRSGITRRVYQELQLTRQLLLPLTAGAKCNVIIRYINELSGTLKRTEIPIDLLQSTLLTPAGRGAQLHLDCPRHHVDFVCSSPREFWAPVKCRGMIQGIHHYQAYCGSNVGVTFAATKGCMLSKALQCSDTHTLGCRLSALCSSISHSSVMYNCDGIPLVKL